MSGIGMSADPSQPAAELLGHRLARPAHFSREVLQLGKAVPHRQHRFGVVQVDGWLEDHSRNGRGMNIGQAKARVLDQHMAAALRAELPITKPDLVEPAKEVRSLRDLYVLLLPQREGTYRCPRVGAAGVAVAVPHL